MLEKIKIGYTFDYYKTGVKIKLFEYYTINLLSFAIPYLLGHPQIVVGTVVNSLIFYVAIRFKEQNIIPVIFLPAVGALMAGLLFGPSTEHLIYFIPFIWVGNAILLFSTRYFLAKEKASVYTVALSSVLKAFFLFLIAVIFVFAFDFPKIYLAGMGPFQLITAMSGGLLTFSGKQLLSKSKND